MPDVQSAAAGFLARTGARDDTPKLAGVSHFLEHMMFKGTADKTWQEINVEFDRMGSTYNAFTSHDRTFFYGWVPTGDIKRQIALLADMMRSAIPPKEFDMEKNVVLEEIAMSKDRIESIAFDFLMEKLFEGQALSWPVLGYEDTVRNLSRDGMVEYFERRYAPGNMVLIVAGNVDPGEVIEMAEELCGRWQPLSDSSVRQRPIVHGGRSKLTTDRFGQQVVVAGFAAAPGSSDACETAEAISVILGGENSRFFWNIVQAGISPSAGAFVLDFSDVGVLLLWGMCEPKNASRLSEAMRAEATRLHADGALEQEVARVRNKRRTSLAVEAEAPYYRLTQIMDDIDYRDSPRTVEQRLSAVDSITPAAIATYLERYPIDGESTWISVGPGNGTSD